MTEETLFAEAVEKSTPAERAAFLDAACSGDAALRQRVEALLQSHAREDFLKTPAIQRAAEVAGGSPIAGATEAEVDGDDSESALDFLVPSEKPDSLGRLGHYEVQEMIGRGGMGVVLRAFDEKLHRVVAIKVVAAQLATNATARKRFVREAQAQAAVSHDHIVTIHAVEADSQLPYLVMQYISGMSLQERLDKNGPMQLHEILRIGMQTAAGLAAAHAQGLVHRDIKPANILLENGVERVKITDFGLARAATEASLTQSGVVAGTPQYMSPEQAEGKAIDQRTDLFSLGSVLYAMCTGRAPFRASGTMAVLKRVCEETPTPIRETNPDIPDWLVAIIDKLHAKDPAQRYQSAAEVAELLGRHLAHVQHPSVVPLVPCPPGKGAGGEGLVPVQPRGRRLAVAAAVLLCFLVGLGLTEATGVTKVRGIVIRIFTPDGTLVVDINDPGVKVTIEGDGGLIITGAGLEEIRLRPGSYKVHAERGGKQVLLERELISISTGGREVVKVKLEAPPTPVVAKTATGAFVLLAAGKERKFDSLADAVLSASDGDTIEVRGIGPFVSAGVKIRQRLVIRAGVGYTPSITLSPEAADRNIPLLTVSAPLVLEGLELRRIGGAGEDVEGRGPKLIHSWHPTELHIANSRLIFNADPLGRTRGILIGTRAANMTVRNCELTVNVLFVGQWHYAAGGRCAIENCVITSGAFGFHNYDADFKDVSVRVRGNTLVGHCLDVTLLRNPSLPEAGEATPPVRLELAGNVAIWDVTTLGFLYFHQSQVKAPVSAAQAEALLPRLVRLDEKQNVYPSGTPMLRLAVDWQFLKGKRGKDLADWDTYWAQKNTGSVKGDIRFEGGDIFTRAQSSPTQLSAADFRLRPDSAGYRAGKDGKDLGADVDLVGPGPAYERWKKTPEYQQWLKDTKQVK